MSVSTSSSRRPLRSDARLSRATRLHLRVSGWLAGVVTVAAMFLLREVSGRESLVELIAHTVVQTMPVEMFAFLLDLLQGSAKQVLLASVILGAILVCGWLAWIDGGPANAPTTGRRFKRIVWLSAGAWLPASLFAVLVTSYVSVEGISNRGLAALSFDMLLVSLTYALSLYGLYPVVRRAFSFHGVDDVDQPPTDLGRRKLVAQAVVAGVALVGAGYLGKILNGITGGSFAGGSGEIPDEVTPVGRFYLISKNFIDPNIDEQDWSLEVTGAVIQPLRLSYTDLMQLPAVEQMTTLTCISNEVGGDLISNAVWTGVPLAHLLNRSGLRPEAAELVIYAADGYTESFSLSKALEPTTLATYMMNGEKLTSRHGFPVRLVVPGKYGIKNVKWVRKLELISGDYKGYWQQRGWTDDATIHTLSRIDVPGSRAIVAIGPQEIGGIAFAGDRGISRVEYSVDGSNWVEADVTQLAPLAWVIWRSTWNPQQPGAYTLSVRATDGFGEVQTSKIRPPIPDGATGLHTVEVGVT